MLSDKRRSSSTTSTRTCLVLLSRFHSYYRFERDLARCLCQHCTVSRLRCAQFVICRSEGVNFFCFPRILLPRPQKDKGNELEWTVGMPFGHPKTTSSDSIVTVGASKNVLTSTYADRSRRAGHAKYSRRLVLDGLRRRTR